MCKASLIFKSNLELVLPIILKESKLHESTHVAVECKMFKNIRLVTLFDMFLNPSFKMTTRFTNVARKKTQYTRKIYI